MRSTHTSRTVEAPRAGFALIDRAGVVAAWHAEGGLAESFLGPEQSRRTFVSFIVDDERAQWERDLAALWQGELDSVRRVCTVQAIDGATMRSMIAVQRVELAEGASYLWLQILEQVDPGALRTLGRALPDERARLRATMHALSDGVALIGADGTVEYLNPAAERLCGVSALQAEGRPVHEVFRMVDPITWAPVEGVVQACLRGDTDFLAPIDSVLQAPNGSRVDVQESVSPLRDASGELAGAVLVLQDVSHLRTAQRELTHNSLHDALTGLPNRRKFDATLLQLSKLGAEDEREHALCYLDIDRFKLVNDTVGHAAGDALLKVVAREICRAVRSNDLVARLGGDEFAVLLFGCGLERAHEIVANILRAVEAIGFVWEERVFHVTASAGLIRLDPRDGVSAPMQKADVACFTAKDAGRNRIRIYDSGHSDVAAQHRLLQVASELKNALHQDRFGLYVQAIESVQRPDEPYYEVLLRMFDSDGVLVPPGDFIPAAERYDLMGEIDRWVVREVLARRDRELARLPGLHLSVNLSGASLTDPYFLPTFLDLLQHSALRPEQLTMEITETAVISDYDAARGVLERMRELGCRIALDDFGVGLSSLAYLRTFPVDLIKIDGAFVRAMDRSSVDAVIIRSIHGIAHEIGARTVAEFVENRQLATQLSEMGIDYLQGFGIARPVPLEQLLALSPAGDA